MRRLVLFDIDGTLLLTAGAGRRAIAAALAELVTDASAYDRVRFDGKTDPQIVSELLAAAGHADPENAERIAEVCAVYVAILERELAAGRTRTQVLPGVAALLARLERESDVVLGLLTGNVAAGARLKLQSARLDPERFAVGAFGSDAADRRALPQIAAERAEPLFGRRPTGPEVVILGDTPADITCGAGIGARAIAVATGSYDLAQLQGFAPHAAFPDLSSTADVLRAILD